MIITSQNGAWLFSRQVPEISSDVCEAIVDSHLSGHSFKWSHEILDIVHDFHLSGHLVSGREAPKIFTYVVILRTNWARSAQNSHLSSHFPIGREAAKIFHLSGHSLKWSHDILDIAHDFHLSGHLRIGREAAKIFT